MEYCILLGSYQFRKKKVKINLYLYHWLLDKHLLLITKKLLSLYFKEFHLDNYCLALIIKIFFHLHMPPSFSNYQNSELILKHIDTFLIFNFFFCNIGKYNPNLHVFFVFILVKSILSSLTTVSECYSSRNYVFLLLQTLTFYL